MEYVVVFDEEMRKQFKKQDHQIKTLIDAMLAKIEEHGPEVGKLIDIRVHH
jgi:hypothetical protein